MKTNTNLNSKLNVNTNINVSTMSRTCAKQPSSMQTRWSSGLAGSRSVSYGFDDDEGDAELI